MFKKLSPIQILVWGYITVVFVAAILFTLPISSSTGARQPFIDALFVSASGISTSGLSPVDIGSFYSFFGQIVLLILFQIGGISYTTFFVFIVYTLGIRLNLMDKIVVKESMAGAGFGNIFKFFRRVTVFTFIFELIGAVILACYWTREFSVSRSIYLGIFHSISAFCTAGFSLFPNGLMPYRGSTCVNLTIDFISIVGGIGFFVLYDLYTLCKKTVKNQYPRRLSVHSKLAIIVTIIVMLAGALVIFYSQDWSAGFTLKDKLLSSTFQSISASTTDGFNTLDIGLMSPTSLFMLILLMFIGASPGSTGGGIKTTTLWVVLLSMQAQLNGRDVNIFKRRISETAIKNAFSIFVWFVVILAVDIIVLTFTENASFLQILFESTSALGNAGLSMGITSRLTDIGKIALTITMFIGRVGPLAMGLFIVGRQKPLPFKYAQEEVFVG